MVTHLLAKEKLRVRFSLDALLRLQEPDFRFQESHLRKRISPLSTRPVSLASEAVSMADYESRHPRRSASDS